MVGPSLFVFKFVLGDCFWCLFWGPFLDSFLAPVLGAQIWALLIRNKKQALILVPVLGPVLGPILGPILGTNLEHFCLVGCLLLKLVVLGIKHLVRATFHVKDCFCTGCSKEGAPNLGRHFS